MISRLRGRLLQRDPQGVVVDVGGVGYEVKIPLSTYYDLGEGEEVELHIHTHVREDDISLFGFRTFREKEIFRRLIAVSGIGPRTAIALLSGLSPDDLLDALRTEDLAKLATVPGVGRKTAERLIVELRDRVPALLARGEEEEDGKTPAPPGLARKKADLLSALENLGYNPRIVGKTVDRILKANPEAPLEALLKETLRSL